MTAVTLDKPIRKRKKTAQVVIDDPLVGKFKVEKSLLALPCAEILPDNCVIKKEMGKNKAFTLFVIELPKGVYFARYSPKKGNPEPHEYYLSWPTTLWWLMLQMKTSYGYPIVAYGGITALKQPFGHEQLETDIYEFPMPNLSSGDYAGVPEDLCLGYGDKAKYASTGAGNEDKDMARFINEYMAGLLGCAWNNGRPPRLELLGIKDMKEWNTGTKKDPEWFSKHIKWTPCRDRKTVREAIEKSSADRAYTY